MKQHLTIVFFLIFHLAVSNAQTKGKLNNNASYLEVGKTGLILNLCFDHKIPDKNLGIRFNIGSNFAKYLSAFSTGVGGYYLFGQTQKHFELGMDLNYFRVDEVSNDQRGLTLIYPNYSIKTLLTSMNIGYRVYGSKSIFRAGLSPILIKNSFLVGGYISYGLTF
jgi:hypothetical protein